MCLNLHSYWQLHFQQQQLFVALLVAPYGAHVQVLSSSSVPDAGAGPGGSGQQGQGRAQAVPTRIYPIPAPLSESQLSNRTVKSLHSWLDYINPNFGGSPQY